jgi:hypothetical protein
MVLNNTYVLKEKSIEDILESLKEFVTTMTSFSKHNKSYKYDIKIIKASVNWNATITVTNEKRIATGKA